MPTQSPIEHVIVLMLENHTFDKMLGFLKKGEGLTGKEFNLVDPANPNSQRVFVSDKAESVTSPDPMHTLRDTNIELFGPNGTVQTKDLNNGFLFDYIRRAGGDLETGKKIMQSYSPDSLPVLSALAGEFCLCDRWFASVPGPTFPNRFYAHAATSDGQAFNNKNHDYAMRTIYNSLQDQNHTWSIYFHDITVALMLSQIKDEKTNFKRFAAFFQDSKSGNLPNYSFLVPRFSDLQQRKANDQHPPHDVSFGEMLIADVYEAIRGNEALWKKSLFIVLYDEHGGSYDHVHTPPFAPLQKYKVRNPDGKNSASPPFKFDRLGLRVPAILVSPFVKKNSLDSTIYEHASIPATIKKLFNLPNFLTERDKHANTFESALSLKKPRDDTPKKLKRPGPASEAELQSTLARTEITEEEVKAGVARGEMSMRPLTDLQQDLIGVANRLDERPRMRALAASHQFHTEHEAAVYINERVTNFLGR
jgi:phospholipase C